MKTQKPPRRKHSSDGATELQSVLWVGVADLSFPLSSSTRRRFHLIAKETPHFAVGYHNGFTFQYRADGVEFYLAPRSWPLLIRVPLFVIWLWSVTFYLVWIRQVRLLVAQSSYEGLLLWPVRTLLRVLRCRVALVVQLQGFAEEVLPLVHPFLRPVKPLLEAVLRWAVRQADVVRAISTATKEYASSLGIKQVFVYPTWTDWELFLEGDAPLPDETSTGFSVIYVGALTPVKGVDLLLEAVGVLVEKRSPIVLTIVGDGPYRQSYQELAQRLNIESQVIWEGMASLERVKELISASYLLVCPSRTEGLGRVVLEAGACGKPVVATSVGGLQEAVKHEQTGILVPPDDVKALAYGIEYMLQHPQEARAMGKRGRDIVRQEYGTERWMQGYRAVLQAAWDSLARD